MGRELTFANPKIIKLVNDHFVPVAMDDWHQRRRKDLEGDFFRHVANQGPRKIDGQTRQGIYALTADGRLLNYKNAQDPEIMRRFLLDALAAWRDIPPAERGRGAMRVEAPGKVDARHAPELPKGAIIVKAFGRILDRQDDFFCHGTCKSPGGQRASRDHLWIRSEEWQALMPTDVKKGQEIPLSEKLLYRLARFHLIDNTRGEPPMWRRADVRTAQARLVVEDVTASEVRLTLTGSFLLATHANVKTAPRGYDAAVRGDLRYDPVRRTLTRFHLVALGEHWGEGPFTGGARPGRTPFGVAFELGDPARPTDRIAPQFLREGNDYWNAHNH